MLQAIQTRYYGPTNTRGSRIVATAAAGSATLPYDHRLNIDGNHEAAALALIAKFEWTDPNYGRLVGGCLPNGDYAFVLTGRDDVYAIRPQTVLEAFNA